MGLMQIILTSARAGILLSFAGFQGEFRLQGFTSNREPYTGLAIINPNKAGTTKCISEPLVN
jgi:hypothetical protein